MVLRSVFQGWVMACWVGGARWWWLGWPGIDEQGDGGMSLRTFITEPWLFAMGANLAI